MPNPPKRSIRFQTRIDHAKRARLQPSGTIAVLGEHIIAKSLTNNGTRATWTCSRLVGQMTWRALLPSDGQTAPSCLLLRPESPCRRGPLDLAIEAASIQVARLGCTGPQDFILSVAG